MTVMNMVNLFTSRLKFPSTETLLALNIDKLRRRMLKKLCVRGNGDSVSIIRVSIDAKRRNAA